MIKIRPIMLVFLVFFFFCCGGLLATVMQEAPRLEEKVKLEIQLRHTQQQAEEYRVRCIGWSHYAFNLENNWEFTNAR